MTPRHNRRLVEQDADRNTQALADGTEGYAKHEGADVLLKDLTGTAGSLKGTPAGSRVGHPFRG